MAVTAQTIANTLAMRAELERYVIEAELRLARMWGVAWREVSDEYALAVADLIDMAEGDWPTRAQVLRAQRVENALKVTLEQLQGLVPQSATAMQDNLASILASADHWSQRIVRTQLPQGVSQTWNRVDVGAMDAIVKRATTRIHALTMPLSRDMVSRMKAVLIRGVVVGENPRAAARQILGRCDQAFSGGRARALNIARTEMVDAHRGAALQARKANRDVVGGWRWHTTLSNRTCPSCLSQHGSLHPADELGPLDHQQGRCTSIPVTKSWRELGFDMEEPPDAFPNAREWFQAQSKDVRQRIMGAERLKQLESGALKWDDLSIRVSTPGWRDSYRVAPLGGGRVVGVPEPKLPGFNPTPFREAKTIQEALDQLQKTMGDRGKVIGFNKAWDLDRVKQVTETTADLFHRFPEVRADVEFAKLKNSKVLAQASALYDEGSRMEWRGLKNMKLEINQGKLTTRSTLNDNWNRDVKQGFYTVRKTDAEDVKPMQWVVRHEFGHLLDFTSGNMHRSRMNAKAVLEDEVVKRGWGRFSAEGAKWRRENTGEYARTSSTEMLAEAFADVQTYGADAYPLSAAIVQKLMEHLGR